MSSDRHLLSNHQIFGVEIIRNSTTSLAPTVGSPSNSTCQWRWYMELPEAPGWHQNEIQADLRCPGTKGVTFTMFFLRKLSLINPASYPEYLEMQCPKGSLGNEYDINNQERTHNRKTPTRRCLGSSYWLVV